MVGFRRGSMEWTGGGWALIFPSDRVAQREPVFRLSRLLNIPVFSMLPKI
jgi:hypothetical protein